MINDDVDFTSIRCGVDIIISLWYNILGGENYAEGEII